MPDSEPTNRQLRQAMLDLKFEVALLQRRIVQLEQESQRRHAVLVEMLCTPGGAQAYFAGAIPVDLPEVQALFRKSPPGSPHSDRE